MLAGVHGLAGSTPALSSRLVAGATQACGECLGNYKVSGSNPDRALKRDSSAGRAGFPKLFVAAGSEERRNVGHSQRY